MAWCGVGGRLKGCQGNCWRDLALSPEEQAELEEAAPGLGRVGLGLRGRELGNSVGEVGRGGGSGRWVGEIWGAVGEGRVWWVGWGSVLVWGDALGVLSRSPPPRPSPLSSPHRVVTEAAVCPHVLVWEDKLGQLLWKRSGRTQEVWPVPILSPLCALLEGCAQVSSYRAPTATPFVKIPSQEQSRCPSPGDLLHKRTELL